MTADAPAETCQHHREIQLMTQHSLSQRPQSLAGTLAQKMRADEVMAACQSECGPNSPYRDVELRPISNADAVTMIDRSRAGYLGIIGTEFADMGRAAGGVFRRLFRRPVARD